METTTSSYQTTPQTQPGTWSLGAKGGVYTGLVFIVYSLLQYITEWQVLTSASTLFTVTSLIIGIWLTHKAFKEQGNGYMSYAQGLGLGTVLGLVAGLLNGALSGIYLAFIDTNYMSRQSERMIIELEDQGMSDAQIEQMMQWMEYTTNPLTIFFLAILVSAMFAFFLSLIVSVFTKNTDPSLEY